MRRPVLGSSPLHVCRVRCVATGWPPLCRQWYYWYLTEEGIKYLRAFLHLPEEVVPETLKKPAPRPGARPVDGGEAKGERRPFGRGAGGFRGDREGGRAG